MRESWIQCVASGEACRTCRLLPRTVRVLSSSYTRPSYGPAHTPLSRSPLPFIFSMPPVYLWPFLSLTDIVFPHGSSFNPTPLPLHHKQFHTLPPPYAPSTPLSNISQQHHSLPPSSMHLSLHHHHSRQHGQGDQFNSPPSIYLPHTFSLESPLHQ